LRESTGPVLYVRTTGLEPARGFPHSDLNAARLPIPPRAHTGDSTGRLPYPFRFPSTGRAPERTRTSTGLPPLRPERSASTNSATSAYERFQPDSCLPHSGSLKPGRTWEDSNLHAPAGAPTSSEGVAANYTTCTQPDLAKKCTFLGVPLKWPGLTAAVCDFRLRALHRIPLGTFATVPAPPTGLEPMTLELTALCSTN
jgi:hypothetical protein